MRRSPIEADWAETVALARTAVATSRLADSSFMRSTDHEGRSVLAEPSLQGNSSIWFTPRDSVMVHEANRLLLADASAVVGAVGVCVQRQRREEAGFKAWWGDFQRGTKRDTVTLIIGRDPTDNSTVYRSRQPRNTETLPFNFDTFASMYLPERRDLTSILGELSSRASALLHYRYVRGMSED